MTEYTRERIDREVEANMAACHAAHEINGCDVDAYKTATFGKTVADRYVALRTIADNMVKTVTPNSACRKGCSHCCNIAVVVNLVEARAISKASGRRYDGNARPARYENTDKWRGVPCPFLRDGRCAVYEVRPLTCRTYFNMSDTTEICDVVSHPSQSVPHLNTEEFMNLAAAGMGSRWSDIRDWFPLGQ